MVNLANLVSRVHHEGTLEHFDAHVVARTHRFLDELRATDTIWDVALRIEAARDALRIRERSSIPI